MKIFLKRIYVLLKSLLNPVRLRFFLHHGIFFDQGDRVSSKAISKIVSRYDPVLLARDMDEFTTDEAKAIFTQGYTLINKFLPSDICDYLREELLNKSNFNSSPLLNNMVFELLADNGILSKVAFDYLGSRARLDYATAEESAYTTLVNSNMWHFDVGGLRLKAFLTLNDCTVTGGQATGLVPNSHRCIHDEQSLLGSRFIQNYKLDTFDNRSKVIFIKQPKGSLLFFDTNGWHRDCYDAETKRQFIEFGFADKLKSEELGGFTSIAHSPNQISPNIESYPAIFDTSKKIKIGNKVFL